MWVFLCGVFTILFMVVAYNCYSKKNGSPGRARREDQRPQALEDHRSVPYRGGRRLCAGVHLRLPVPHRLPPVVLHHHPCICTHAFATIAKYLVFWLVYYIALSVATNGFNFVQLGKSNWLSTLVQMFFVFIGPEIMIGVQYITFYNKGFLW